MVLLRFEWHNPVSWKLKLPPPLGEENDIASPVKFACRPRFQFDKPGFSDEPSFLLEKLGKPSISAEKPGFLRKNQVYRRKTWLISLW